MTHAPANMPPPMAMPTLPALVRAVNEECTNAIFADRKNNNTETVERVELPNNVRAWIHCKKSAEADFDHAGRVKAFVTIHVEIDTYPVPR